MTHRFPIKEIARQAGLGTATVDRVINDRPHVSPQTRARVAAAISELEGQEAQLAARGRRMFFDVVVEAQARFSGEVRRAAEAVVPGIDAAVCRPRFLLQEQMDESEVIAALGRIAKRGSQGVCLKARALPGIAAATGRLVAAGIPVVTLVTDIPGSDRVAYVGLDNIAAGRTAAYLIAERLAGQQGTVLATKSQRAFLGEEERESSFAEALSRRCSELRIVDASGGSGVPFETAQSVEAVIAELSDLKAVYSMGGGNAAILAVLDDHGIRPDAFIAHDLDRENRVLMGAGRLSFVLHHDLRADLRNAFRALLSYHGLVPAEPSLASPVQIISPENVPPLDSTIRA